MEYFLKQLEVIRREFKMLDEREEKFNIFSTLYQPHDERRLHSRFISVLLQPNGSHGKGNLFLKHFLEISDIDSFNCDENVLVFPRESDKKENSDIDILIINRSSKQCIIIENKIYANDSITASVGQLFRYIEHVRQVEKIDKSNIHVIYLTLDGHEPSEDSLGAHLGFKNLQNLSYVELILPWLSKCLQEVPQYPHLRESIIQYQKLITKMTGNSASIEERLAYKQLIGQSEDNMKSAKSLIANFKHVKWHAVNEFWEMLQNRIIEEPGLELVKAYDSTQGKKPNNVITELTHYEDYRVGQKKKQQCYLDFKCSDDVLLSARFKGDYRYFYFGMPKGGNDNPKNKYIASELIKLYVDYRETSTMLLSKNFNNDLKFNDFLVGCTFDIINPSLAKKYVDESFEELKILCERILKINKSH